MARWEKALITGGATGIGAAIVRELVREGTHVVICGRRKEPLDALCAELGERVYGIQGDVSDPARAEAIVKEAAERLGGLDLVIANAGFGGNKPAPKLELRHVIPILETNVLGSCATLTAAIPIMVAAGRGHLVGISSLAGYRGLPTSAAYSASKAALSTFLESIRVDLYRTGVRVTDVRPGFVDTPLTKKNRFKMPFLLPPDVAARKILRAVERKRRVFPFPWPTWLGVLALTLVPRWLYDRIASGVRAEKEGT